MAERLQRIRGQEASIRFTTREIVAGIAIIVPLEGSFFKVRDFTWNPVDDISEDGFIGEVADDLDYLNHGFAGSFSIDKADPAATNYVVSLVATSRNRVQPLETTMQVEYIYRDTTTPSTILIFSEGIMKMASEAIAGRKEFVNNSFEWKSKHMKPLAG